MKLFSKEEWKLLWPFYLDSFLATALYISIPFMVLYFSSIGFSPWQIGILMAASPFGALLFEIPTGAVADIYGRKFSVISGWFISGVLMMMVYFFNDFYSILILMFLLGAAFTLTSGSSEAWVVDLLKANKLKLVSSFFSKKQSLYNLAFVFSGVLGAFFVGMFGLGIIWIVTGMSYFASVFLLLFGQEVYVKRKIRIKRSFKELKIQTKKSIIYGYRHHVLFYLFAIAALFGIFSSLTSPISWTPFLKDFNMPDAWFGYLWSISGMLGIIAPMISNKLSKKHSLRNILVLSSLLSLIVGVLVLFSFNLAFAIIIILFYFFILDFDIPIWNTYFHKFSPTRMRATLGSIQNMLGALSSVAGVIIAGLLVESFGGKYTIFIGGLLMIPTLILYLKIKEKKGKK